MHKITHCTAHLGIPYSLTYLEKSVHENWYSNDKINVASKAIKAAKAAITVHWLHLYHNFWGRTWKFENILQHLTNIPAQTQQDV